MKVLVAYKKSTFQIYARERRDPKLLRLLRERLGSASQFFSSTE